MSKIIKIEQQSIDQVLRDLKKHLLDFEKLRHLYSDTFVQKTTKFYKEIDQCYSQFTNSFFHNLGLIVSFLNKNISRYSEYEQSQILFKIFDDLDIYNNNPNTTNINNILAEGGIFINTNRYWKSNSVKPISSFKKSFSSFGLLSEFGNVELIDVGDLIDNVKLGLKSLDKLPSLNIGLFPLSRDFKVNFRLTKSLNADRKIIGFLTNKQLNNNFKDELDNILKVILDNQLQIICLPELIVDDISIEYLKNKLKAENLEFFILIGGSFHRQHTEGHFKNTAPIYFFINGEIIEYKYSKLEQLSIEFNRLGQYKDLVVNANEFSEIESSFIQEDFVPDSDIIVFDLMHFGKIGIVICKDLLTDNSYIVNNYTKLVDHLFVVSLNFGEKSDFEEKSIHLANEHSISTFYVNARAFVEGNKFPSYVYVPKKENGQNISKIENEGTYLKKSIKKFNFLS